jgi:hypothetical protein
MIEKHFQKRTILISRRAIERAIRLRSVTLADVLVAQVAASRAMLM